MANELCLKTLGGLTITLNDEPIGALASRKAEGLLVYLACNPRAHPREVLADLLWDERTQRQAASNLRVVLSSLRKQVGAFLEITRHTAEMRRGANIWLDVARLEGSVSRALIDTSAGTMQALEEALGLYKGDFLQGFSVAGATGLEGWIVSTRERAHRLTADGWQRLGEYYLGQETFEQAIGAAEQLLALDPFADGGCRQLMEALARTGRRGEALARFEAFRARLRDELGVDPAVETQALARGIGENVLTPGLKGEALGIGRRPPLPTPASPLIGREADMATVSALLDEGARLVSIVGPGGMGKTSLALAAARDLEGRFAHGAAFVSLASLPSVDGLPTAVAQGVGLSFDAGDRRAPQAQLLAYLRNKELLLVLDNFEHLLEGAPMLSEIVEAAPGVSLMATSRERLNLQAEHVHHLQGLAFSKLTTVESAQRDPAVALFLQRAQRARASFALREEQLPALLEILRLVEGMPLGVILAAGWAAVMSPAEIAAEIGLSLDFLEATTRDLPQRQRSMRAVFESTWRRLSAREQRLLAAISVFRGGFTLEAAREVAGATPRDLLGLVERSLLARQAGGRFEQHELLRQFAAEELAGMAEVRERHSTYYCRFVKEHEAGLKGSGALQAGAQLKEDFENVQLACTWAADQRRADLLEQVAPIVFYCEREHRIAEAAAMFRRASQNMAQTMGSPDAAPNAEALSPFERRVFSWVLTAWGAFERDMPVAVRRQLLEQALIHAQAAAELDEDSRYEEALVKSILPQALWGVDQRGARAMLEQSQVLFRQLEKWYELAHVTGYIGTTYELEADYVRAHAFAVEAVRLWEIVGIAHYLTLVRLDLARMEIRLGFGDGGIQVIRQLIEDLRADEKEFRAAETQLLLSGDLTMLGRFSEALVAAKEGHAYMTRVRASEREPIAWSRIAWAWAGLHLGRFDQGLEKSRKALAQAREDMQVDDEAWFSFVHGCCALALGKLDEALEFLALSVRKHREIDGHQDLAFALAATAMASAQRGRLTNERAPIAESLRLAKEWHLRQPAAMALAAAAASRAATGEPERAIELYVLACTEPFVGNSRWFETVVGKRVWEAAAGMPAEAVEAARERGEGLGLWQGVAEVLGRGAGHVTSGEGDVGGGEGVEGAVGGADEEAP